MWLSGWLCKHLLAALIFFQNNCGWVVDLETVMIMIAHLKEVGDIRKLESEGLLPPYWHFKLPLMYFLRKLHILKKKLWDNICYGWVGEKFFEGDQVLKSLVGTLHGVTHCTIAKVTNNVAFFSCCVGPSGETREKQSCIHSDGHMHTISSRKFT